MLDGLVILQDFDFGKISRQPSEDLRKELARLNIFQLQTIVKCGSGEEVREARVTNKLNFLSIQAQQQLALKPIKKCHYLPDAYPIPKIHHIFLTGSTCLPAPSRAAPKWGV